VIKIHFKVLCQLEDDEQSADLTRKDNFSGKRRLPSVTLVLTSLLHLQVINQQVNLILIFSRSRKGLLFQRFGKKEVSVQMRERRGHSVKRRQLWSHHFDLYLSKMERSRLRLEYSQIRKDDH